MHNCKTIKDLILTDYVDNQLDAFAKSQVEAHLLQCTACQEFAAEVKNLAAPLEQSSRREVPERVWNSIREKICKEEYVEKTVTEKIQDWLQGFSWPRLMPALGSLTVLILLASTVLLNQPKEKNKEEDAVLNLTEMLTLTAVSSQVSSEPGTPIEKYFL